MLHYPVTFFLLIQLVHLHAGVSEDSCMTPVDFVGVCDNSQQTAGACVGVGVHCQHINVELPPIICDQGGVWREDKGVTSPSHHVHKRFIGVVVGAISAITGIIGTVCMFVCKDDEGRPVNTPPSLICPPVESIFTAAKGDISVAVTWDSPDARDKEDDSVLVDGPITGLPSGSIFEEGSHYIQYMVTDSEGLSAYCSIQFKVEVNRCQPIQWPQYGTVTCDKRDISGSKCLLSCYEGYEPAGDSEAICNTDSWSTQFQCLPKVCSITPPIENGEIFCVGKTLTYKTACVVNCNKGFVLDGSPMIICGANGEFSMPGKCVDSEAPEFPNGCPADITGYAEMNGGPKEVTWGNLTVIDNSNAPPTVTSTPASDHKFPPGRTIVTVEATDAAGNTGRCSFAVLIKTLVCDEPDFDRSGKNLLIYDCPDGMMYGDTCNVSCKSGYPLEGSGSVLCDIVKDSDVQPQVQWTMQDGILDPYCKINPCPDLPAPLNGALACDRWNHGKMCQMQCNDKYDVPRSVPEQYVCGESTGQWRPNDIIRDCTELEIKETTENPTSASYLDFGIGIQNDGSLCTKYDKTVRHIPGSMTMPSKLYYFTGNCTDTATQQQIKDNFIKMLTGNVLFKESCVDVPDCRAEFVSVKCGDSSRRRKRSVGTDVIIDFNIIQRYHEDENHRYKGIQECEKQLNLVGKAINQAVRAKSLNIGISDMELHDDSFEAGLPDFTCGPGTKPVYDTASCAGCPLGTFYNKTTDDCADCPVGSYQDEDSSSSCKLCSEGFSTLAPGSKSPAKCIAMCDPGTYSSTGLLPCSPCPQGRYQTLRGKTSCITCPAWKTTLTQGSSETSDCINYDIHAEEEVTVGHINSALSSLSMITWMFLEESPTNASCVIGLDDTILLIISDQIALRFSDKALVYENTVSTRQWLHIAYVIDIHASTFKLFINGNNVVTKTVQGMSSDLVQDGARLHIKSISGVTVSSLNVVGRPLSDSEIVKMSSLCGASINDSTVIVGKDLSSIQVPSKCDDINECETRPCGKHICINEVGGHKCQCLKGYSGQFCQNPPDHCIHHTCENGAQCLNNYNNFSCICKDGFKGTLCEHLIVHGGWSDWGDWGECTETCGGGIMTRTRKCNSPPPDVDGKPCIGSDKMTEVCNARRCRSCVWLPESEGVIRSCNSYNGTIVCTITCREGLVFTQTVLSHYFCGRETNYKWNHQTAKNPSARLPACTAPKTPEGYTLKHEMDYSTLPCSLSEGQQGAIEDQILLHTDNLDLPCLEDKTCQRMVQIDTCDDGSRRKRESGTSVTLILATRKETAVPLNMSVILHDHNELPERIHSAILKIAHFEQSAQTLVNNHSSVFTVTLSGVSYAGDIGSAKSTVELDCPLGTTRVSGLCGECPPGTKSVDGLCDLCGRGMFQEAHGKLECIPCPAGKTTLGLGSISVTDCNTETDTRQPNKNMVAVTTVSALMALTIIVAIVVVTWRIGRNKRRQCLVPPEKSQVTKPFHIFGRVKPTQCEYEKSAAQADSAIMSP